MRSKVHIEVILRNICNRVAEKRNIEAAVLELLRGAPSDQQDIVYKTFEKDYLTSNVREVRICRHKDAMHQFTELDVNIHVVKLEKGGAEGDEMEEGVTAAEMWLLPCEELHNLWDNLIFESSIKEDLISFMESILIFSERGVDKRVVTCNRMILLHGPPGTGKTSLCRSLAQKMSIRFSGRYASTQLVEINSHSLFSKYFSESGKLVMRMFSYIRDLVETTNNLFFILIDEVESLAHARSASLKSSEPSDAIRTVNALLTQIDQISRYSNVIILATSNVTEAIDEAFVDRADFVRHIGPPPVPVIYDIYLSCLQELTEKGILTDNTLCSYQKVSTLYQVSGELNASQMLLQAAKESVGLSGRFLRKLPLLTHARFLKSVTCSVRTFIELMRKAIESQHQENGRLKDMSVSQKHRLQENGIL